MPTLKRDREDMADDGARKRTKTSPSVDEIHTIHPIMDLTADETPSKPGADAALSQDLQVYTPPLLLLESILICIYPDTKYTTRRI
jgi:hypothetical protein